MKNYKKLLSTICAVGFISVLLSSCLKDNNSTYYNPNVALVTVIQTSPGQPGMDLFFDTNHVTGLPLNYGEGINYFQAYSGTRVANFFQYGTLTKIVSDTVLLKQNTAYSMFVAGVKTHPEVVLLTDTLNKPADGQGGIRFINLSPDAGAVDLVVHGSTALVSNKAYKAYSTFVPLAGHNTYTFDVRQAGTTTVLATLSNINLNTGFLYTIWFYGLATPATPSDKLAVGITNNAYF